MGVVSDHFGRRTAMLGGLIVLSTATVIFAFAQSYGLLLFARIIQGKLLFS
jgi:predicted MFS family arabinose efflux permease